MITSDALLAAFVARSAQLFESGTQNLLRAEPARLVVSAVGAFDSCDLYFSAPEGAGAAAEIRVYGRVGDVRILLATTNMSSQPLTVTGTREGALLVSIRGRPCASFEVECTPVGDEPGLQFFLQAWQGDASHDVTFGTARVSTVKQGEPAASAGRWPVFLSDGSAAQGLAASPLFVRLSDGTAAAGTAANPLPTRAVCTLASFSVASDVVTGPTTVGSVISLAYLWGNTAKRIEIHRIDVSWMGGDTAGQLAVRGCFITALDAAPGGTALLPLGHERSDTATAAFRYAATRAPTRVTPLVDSFAVAAKGGDPGLYTWEADDYGKPIVLRPSTQEGFEVRAVGAAAFTSSMKLVVTMHWVEI